MNAWRNIKLTVNFKTHLALAELENLWGSRVGINVNMYLYVYQFIGQTILFVYAKTKTNLTPTPEADNNHKDCRGKSVPSGTAA